MMPIQTLLGRIRWDRHYGAAEFVLGYDDRLADTLRLVSLRHVFQESGDHFFVRIADEEGRLCTVPLHRIKEVYRNGELVWKREH